MLFNKHHIIALESFEQNTNANKFCLANDWNMTEKHKDPKQNTVKLIFRKQLYTQTGIQRQRALHPNLYKRKYFSV